MPDWTWAPIPWFLPVVAALTGLAILLAVRGWVRGGALLGVVVPWLLGTAVLALGVMQWHLADQALLLKFSWYGEVPPPVARFYLYVGAVGVAPLLACFARPWLRRRFSAA